MRRGIRQSLTLWLRLRHFWRHRGDFYRQLAEALEQKELLRDFIAGEWHIAKQAHTADRSRARALGRMQSALDRGATSLADVLISVMPAGDAMGLRVLQDSQQPAIVLRRLGAVVDEQMAMTRVIAAAFATPLFLIPVVAIFSYLFSTRMVPAFVATSPPEIWVGYAQFIRVMSDLIARFGPTLLAVLALLAIWAFAWLLPNGTSHWRFAAENAHGWRRSLWRAQLPVLQPILVAYRDIQASRLLADLVTLLLAGRALQQALVDLSSHASPWMRAHLRWVAQHLTDAPGDYVGAFSHGILSRELLAELHSRTRRDAGHDFAAVLIDLGTKGQVIAQSASRRLANNVGRTLLVLLLAINVFFATSGIYLSQILMDANSPAAIQKRLLLKQRG